MKPKEVRELIATIGAAVAGIITAIAALIMAIKS